MTKMTCSRAVWLGLLIGYSLILETASVQAAPFQGYVVDAETGEPLEGTVIAVRWDRGVFFPCMDSCTTYYDAAEAVADAQGKFSIDISMGLLADRREIVIYKPGYLVPDYDVYPWVSLADGPQPISGQTIRLIKIKTRRHTARFTPTIDYCNGSYDTQRCVPQRKIPNYVRLHEVERKIRGN